MDAKKDGARPNADPERLIVVDSSKFTELLVSRRKLERVFHREDRLHDVETHETFMQELVRRDVRSEAGLAKGA